MMGRGKADKVEGTEQGCPHTSSCFGFGWSLSCTGSDEVSSPRSLVVAMSKSECESFLSTAERGRPASYPRGSPQPNRRFKNDVAREFPTPLHLPSYNGLVAGAF